MHHHIRQLSVEHLCLHARDLDRRLAQLAIDALRYPDHPQDRLRQKLDFDRLALDQEWERRRV